ncbi:RpiB/LacA/LacB family sugar-phosphate isomerase [Rickettsiales endosymbiont of Stachyamoeba lipophora]|uniref:RpiB/LacA/LacB family sugar-phosphate isomerase n=1 Tax=Rickettsiales endosymbiont of Stachyamoeba lipophora TaxID=2486578 RepID=UPI000F655726|nr:RpiB/LacA/LacB family sugar-phosphate isomerase [Rickettsiales endosymbiont of Stachyamoeba lipophora]AZL15818.1 RpiB/LacA/LacB family sugar-phosphate isomerase [Rickettsiales endosymbiont of Stachyamoeba lipophora]
MKQNIYIASDHAGFNLKKRAIEFININFPNFNLIDLGCDTNDDSCDYPDFAYKLAKLLAPNTASLGILICGTGIGISIAANRFNWIRAALCYTKEAAVLAKEHNDANVLVLGSRMLAEQNHLDIIQAFITSNFSGDKRHQQRITKLSKLGGINDLYCE